MRSFRKLCAFSFCGFFSVIFVAGANDADAPQKPPHFVNVNGTQKPRAVLEKTVFDKEAGPDLPKVLPKEVLIDTEKGCAKAYQRLFNKPSLKIRIVFGYKDSRPARFVGDRHERLAFVQHLLENCSGHNQACGFERSFENSDLFMKTIGLTLAEGNKSVRIYLWVVGSSISSNDESNRTDPFQNWQTIYARSAFYTGISEADVVFYNGHSRFGGGPDFGPPRLTSNLDVDAAYYANQLPGLTLLREAFHHPNTEHGPFNQVKILGLFSCSSSQHFVDAVTGDTGVISSPNLVYYADAIENSLATLSAILEMRCPKEFNAALKQGAPSQGMHLKGFFSSITGSTN